MSTKKFCDIDGCKTNDLSVKTKNVTVKFTTEQEGGTKVADPYRNVRTKRAYLDKVEMDFCTNHWDEYVQRFALLAEGAQGYNKYSFDNEGATE